MPFPPPTHHIYTFRISSLCPLLKPILNTEKDITLMPKDQLQAPRQLNWIGRGARDVEIKLKNWGCTFRIAIEEAFSRTSENDLLWSRVQELSSLSFTL